MECSDEWECYILFNFFFYKAYWLTHFFLLGVDLSANQNDVTQHETFQLEYDAKGDRWCISTFEGKYWAFGAASTVQASNSLSGSDRAYFRLVWNTDDGTCSLMALETGSGQLRSLGARKSGQLFTGGPESIIRFYVKFLNRTSISLRGANASGFVGTKGQGKRLLWW